jgi:hypothetical protein
MLRQASSRDVPPPNFLVAGAVPVVVGAAVPCAVQGEGDESPASPLLPARVNWLGTVPAHRVTCSLLSLSLVVPPIRSSLSTTNISPKLLAATGSVFNPAVWVVVVVVF